MAVKERLVQTIFGRHGGCVSSKVLTSPDFSPRISHHEKTRNGTKQEQELRMGVSSDKQPVRTIRVKHRPLSNLFRVFRVLRANLCEKCRLGRLDGLVRPKMET